jgi:hypothetical protein
MGFGYRSGRSGPTGKIESIKILHDMVPFTDFAIAAMRKWQFRAATLKGKPIRSQVAIAYVFQTPYAANN